MNIIFPFQSLATDTDPLPHSQLAVATWMRECLGTLPSNIQRVYPASIQFQRPPTTTTAFNWQSLPIGLRAGHTNRVQIHGMPGRRTSSECTGWFRLLVGRLLLLVLLLSWSIEIQLSEPYTLFLLLLLLHHRPVRCPINSEPAAAAAASVAIQHGLGSVGRSDCMYSIVSPNPGPVSSSVCRIEWQCQHDQRGGWKRFIICHRIRKWVNRIQCLNDTNFPISLL